MPTLHSWPICIQTSSTAKFCLGVVDDMPEEHAKVFIQNVTAEIRSWWLWKMVGDMPDGYGPKSPPFSDPGLQRFVSDFVNSFCSMNGAAPGTSQKEALETIISTVKDEITSEGKRFFFSLFTEMIIDSSFEKEDHLAEGTLAKKYLSKLNIPDMCQHSSWKDFDSIYDDDDNLKPEYRTQAEIDQDDKYTEAGRSPGKRKRKKSKNGASSHSLNMAQDLCINPILSTTVEKVFGTAKGEPKSSGATRAELRERWWDKLIGPTSRKRVCRF